MVFLDPPAYPSIKTFRFKEQDPSPARLELLSSPRVVSSVAERSLRPLLCEVVLLVEGLLARGGFEVRPLLCEALLLAVNPPAQGGCEVRRLSL